MNYLFSVCVCLLFSFACVNGITFGNVGIDISGTSLASTTASSVLACASQCDLNANCNGWSWDSCGKSACYLFSVATSNVANSCRTSSAKLGEVGVDRVGGEISGYNPYVLAASSTASVCAQLCLTTSGCVTWSFDNKGRQNCYLKNAIPATTTPNTTMTSAVQGTINLNSPYYGINTVILSANATATQCSKLCFATPLCKVWLYQPPSAACGTDFAGFCWQKTTLYYSPSADSCFITGTQPISTAPVKTIQRTTPANLVAGLPKKTFPFSRIVAFGDNLSDNGNGSYAHCVAAPDNCQNAIYGFRTWTNGPVAVSFLSTYLNASLDFDYAYGHANGGSLFGATIDNSYTNSTAHSPSAKDQIANYTSSPGFGGLIAKTLHFLWIGANDINLYHINVDSTDNTNFANTFSALLVARVQSLISAGAKYIFVPNLYPKHVAPSVVYYTNTAVQVANLGSAILQANKAIKSQLAQFGSSVIYHDTYSFMLQVYNNHTAYGITHINGEYCDGYNQMDWELCVMDAQGERFYWMQTLDMTSYVHNLVAADMYKTIVNSF